MNFISFLTLISIIYQCNCAFLNTNLTDFSKCQIHYARSGSVYKDFYELSESVGHSPGMLLDFHFSVLAPSDAHILLAPSRELAKDDPAYEIVIGAGGNTFCDIRRKQKSEVKASLRINGLLSSLDIQSFWIHISNEGVIEVGKEGNDLGFLAWTDPDPLPITVVSFSSWSGIEAKFLFNCPKALNSTGNHSKEIIKKRPPLEQLRRDLLSTYDPYVRPVQNQSEITVIGFTVKTDSLDLNDNKGMLIFKGRAELEWLDEKLKWNSSHYDDIKELHIFRREIWVPNLYCFNCIPDGEDILLDTILVVDSKGHVQWTTLLQTTSWCDVQDQIDQWPNDIHQCSLLLGFLKDVERLQLMFNSTKSSFITNYSHKWTVLEVETTSNLGWSQNTSFLEALGHSFDPPSLLLTFKIQRRQNALSRLLYTPIYYATVLSAMIFWVSPFGYLKLVLACLQLLISTVVLLSIDLIVPTIRSPNNMPQIYSLYNYSLIGCVISIIISIIVINISRNEYGNRAPPHFLQKLLMAPLMSTILYLPYSRPPPNQYGNLMEPHNLTKLDGIQHLWTLVGVAIDRISFVCFLFVALWIEAS